MKNQIEIIKTETILGKVLHVYGTPEDPLFLAQNVADWLGHSDSSKMVESLDDEEKLLRTILGAGQQQRKVLMVTEFGLYEILMQSRKPNAKAFKKEVKRVLKELRVHGFTATKATLEELITNPELARGLAERVIEERAAKDRAIKERDNEKTRADLNEQKTILANFTIREQAPKVLFSDAVAGSLNSILVREYAKLLCDGSFEIGEKRLYKWFRDKGYLNRKNEPYQEYVKQGLFEVIERTAGDPDGIFTSRTTKITGKGQVYFAEKIRPNKNLFNQRL